MLEFLSQYWLLIVVLLGVVGLIAYSVKKNGAYNTAMAVAEELINEAKELVEKSGKEKFEWVKENGYAKLPISVRMIIPKDVFGDIVQFVYDDLKEWAEEK